MEQFKAYIIATITLFLVIDPFGSLPIYLSMTEHLTTQERKRITRRELCLALLTMMIFYYVGEPILDILNVDKTTIHISGGIILFLIGMKLVFSQEKMISWKLNNSCWFPLATPLIAGPSVLALIMIYSQEPLDNLILLLAITSAWAVTSCIILFAKPLYAVAQNRGLFAARRLMGLILVLVSIQKILYGIHQILL